MTNRYTIPYDPAEFDLVRCVSSGQVFRWRNPSEGLWVGQDGANAYRVAVHRDRLEVESTAPEAAFRSLFRLDWNAGEVIRTILERGPELAPYVEAIPGLRVVRSSSRVEAFTTFLCTPNNNLTRIMPMAWHLGTGGPVIAEHEQMSLHAFPSLEQIADWPDPALRSNGFGYRAKTIPEAARQVVQRGGAYYLDQLAQASYFEAMAELVSVKGIGPKLADCISLFALDHMEAAPIDTHLWQAVVRLYFPQWADESLTAKRYVEIGEFLRGRFGDLSGWAHQYLFYDNVLNWRERRKQTS